MQTRTATLGTDQERAVTVEIRMVIRIRYQRNKEYILGWQTLTDQISSRKISGEQHGEAAFKSSRTYALLG